jgi:hypothetical protein
LIFASGYGVGHREWQGDIAEASGEKFEVLRIVRVVQHGVDTGRGNRRADRFEKESPRPIVKERFETEKTGC